MNDLERQLREIGVGVEAKVVTKRGSNKPPPPQPVSKPGTF